MRLERDKDSRLARLWSDRRKNAQSLARLRPHPRQSHSDTWRSPPSLFIRPHARPGTAEKYVPRGPCRGLVLVGQSVTTPVGSPPTHPMPGYNGRIALLVF